MDEPTEFTAEQLIKIYALVCYEKNPDYQLMETIKKMLEQKHGYTKENFRTMQISAFAALAIKSLFPGRSV